MLKLSDFFQPLNLVTLSYFLGSIVFFDVLGMFVKRFFIKDTKIDAKTRLLDWLLGLGLFVFIWFLLGFFVPPSQHNILISVVLLFLVSFPRYLIEKRYLSLFSFVKPLILPIILLIPFLPPTFVKASLPPYAWDEMAYHFISPYEALHIGVWQFTGGVYQNVPRIMDTLYVLSFSLLHTYSVVRLIQFSILITSIFSAYLFIKKSLGNISAILFILIIFSLPLGIPELATIGYVDIAALSFLLIGLVLAICFLFFNKKDYLVVSLIFWAMSVGTKYTTLTAFAAFIVSFLIVYWFKNKSFRRLLDKKVFLKIVLGMVIFGGYWYIKNIVIYGNPVYPFFFPCWGRYAQDCIQGSFFFGTWTTPINFNTFYFVIKTLLPQNIILYVALALSPFLLLLYSDKKSRILLLLFSLSFGIELLIMKYFSGFDGRYQQYLMITLILVITLFFSIKPKLLIIKMVQLVLLFVLIMSCVFFYLKNARDLNSLRYVNWQEINYSLGKENIYDWIKFKLPDVAEATIYCDNPSGGPLNLVIFDPDMIWFTYNGLNRVYLLGCYTYNPPGISLSDWGNFVAVAKEKKLQFWTISNNSCVADDKVTPGMEKTKSDSKFFWRQVNNSIVCNSIPVVKDLYYFDYKKLN